MDDAFRIQVLRATIRDRKFLKATFRDLDPQSFPQREEQLIAKASLEFYEANEEPIGSLIRFDVEELAEKQKVGSDTRKKIRSLLDQLQSANFKPVSLKALEDRVKVLKRQSFYERALDEIITAQEKDVLDATLLSELVDRANRELSQQELPSVNYFEGLEERIKRRQQQTGGRRYPWIGIDPLDKKIRFIPRKHLGLWLGPYKAGKSLALRHTAVSYAMQGWNTLFITLEDPRDQVEDSMDASLASIPMSRLAVMPNKLRKRFERSRKAIHGRIKIIEATEGGMTMGKVQQLWERERQTGFIADSIIVDYDDELESDKKFGGGDSARRQEFAHIYRQARQLASKLDVIFWTGAQGTRASEGKRVVTGKDAAEDISKIRKVTVCLGIGSDPKQEDTKFVYVAAHKLDRSRFGVEIPTSFSEGLFFDREQWIQQNGNQHPV